MSSGGTSPKEGRKRTPLQKELMQVIKGRRAKGLAADVSPEEDDGDSAAASGSDDDVLTELNNTLKFKKNDESGKQQARGTAASVPNVGRPNDSDKGVSRRPISDVRPAPPAQPGKNTFGPADSTGRKSPLNGRLDSGSARAAPVSSHFDGLGRKSPSHSHFDAAGGDRKSPLESLPASGSSGRKSPLDGLLDSGGKRSPFDGSTGAIAGGRQSPLDALLDFKKPRPNAATPAALTPPQHRLSPAAGQRSSAPSPTQLSDTSRGSEPSSARHTPRDRDTEHGTTMAAAASPRLSPLVAGAPTAKGELTSKQKEEIIFGKSGTGEVKKPSGTDKPASANKLASILGIGDSKKTAQQSKSPRSELDSLLADEKPAKEDKKPWQPPQFKKPAPSPTHNEDGRKTPTELQGRSLVGNLPADNTMNREPAPKPKPRSKGHWDEQQNGETLGDGPTITDRSGRSTPSSLGRRTPGAASDASMDELAQGKLPKPAQQRAGKPGDQAASTKGGKAGSSRSTPTADEDAKGQRVASEASASSAVDLFGRKASKSPADVRSNASSGSGRVSPAAAAAIARSHEAATRESVPPRVTNRGAVSTAGREVSHVAAGGWGFVAKGADGDVAAVSSRSAGKKGYLQSLLGTAGDDNEENDDDDAEDHRNVGKGKGGQSAGQSYLNQLLQQAPAGGETSPHANGRESAMRKRAPKRADAAGDRDSGPEDSEGKTKAMPRAARHKANFDADRNEADDSSVCFDVDKDPSQLAREKAEREARLQRFGKKQLTEKQENEMRIYEVADAQTSSMLRPIEPDVVETPGSSPVGKKAPVKPKARYAHSGGSQSPTSSTLSRSFDSTSDIRQFIYDEWKRAKHAQTREERKAQALKEKEEEEKKKKDAAEKLASSKASYDSWKETKAKALADMAKAQKEEERKKKELERKKAEDKAAAELAFRRWKEEKDETIKASLMKAMKEKHKKEKEAKEEQKAKEKDCTSAFLGWKTKKDEKLKESLTEEEKQKRAEEEAKRRAQQDSEKMAEELYRQWIHKKEQQKEKERRLRRERKLLELENPRPAWSPPNKTVPHMR